MNIVFITSTINQNGGIERVISRLSNYFIEKLNYNVDIISVYSKEENSCFSLNEKIDVKNLGIELQQKNSLKSRIIKTKEINKKIKQILNRENYDIIITFQAPISNAILFNRKALKENIIVTEHVNYKFYGKLRHIINILNFKKADKLVVLTKYDEAFYSKFIKNVEVIPNAISFNTQHCCNYNAKKILAVGRIEEAKGFDYLIDAFNLIADKYNDWKLQIIGDGSQKQILNKKIREYGLQDRIKIKPFTQNIKQEYLQASIYALSSRVEGLPLVLLEAMECGLPIVSFDIEPALAVLKDGKDSLIARSFNVQEFANNLEMLIQDERKREDYGKKAKKNVQEYKIDNMLLKWDKLFKNIIK